MTPATYNLQCALLFFHVKPERPAPTPTSMLCTTQHDYGPIGGIHMGHTWVHVKNST